MNKYDDIFIEQEELLYEIDLRALKPNQISKNKMRIGVKSILLVIPDTNTYFTPDYLPILYSNCSGIISPPGMMNIGGIKIKGNVEIKRNLGERKLKILQSLPLEPNESTPKYMIYDMTIFSKYLKTISSKYKDKKLTAIFMKELSTFYNFVKNRYPTHNVETIFISTDNNGKLFDIYNNIRYSDNLFYDNYCLVSNSKNVIIPIMGKKRFKNYPILTNISYILNLLNINNDNTNEFIDEVEPLSTKGLPKDLNTFNTVDKTGKINAGISRNKLNEVLKKYNIDDPDIIANILSAIELYKIKKMGQLTAEETQLTVLRAVNYSLHGKDEIDEDYINNPAKLFRKIKESSFHKTPLKFPKLDYLITPEDIIELEHTTGIWRQKQEYEHTIHNNVRKLFSTLENVPNYPIKVKNIKHEIIDDDLTRYIKYTVTLENTAGGKKEPYDVELKVPASMNDKYFKINGSNYIMATQQMMKPITKTESDKVRILTNYTIIMVGIKNLKFNPADIEDLIEYIQSRYAGLIKSFDGNKIILEDNSKLYLDGEILHEKPGGNITISKETGKIINEKNDTVRGSGKFEYIYDEISRRLLAFNPEDRLSKSTKSIPYLEVYIGGFQIPLILYFWQLKGLLTSLNEFEIDYEISKEHKFGDIVLEQDNGEYLIINPKTTRQKYIVNGLLSAKNIHKHRFKNFEDIDEINMITDQTYGSKASYHMKLITQNIVDPVTKELLEYENLPTEIPKLIKDHCIDKLLNTKKQSLADLNIYRARYSEVNKNASIIRNNDYKFLHHNELLI